MSSLLIGLVAIGEGCQQADGEKGFTVRMAFGKLHGFERACGYATVIALLVGIGFSCTWKVTRIFHRDGKNTADDEWHEQPFRRIDGRIAPETQDGVPRAITGKREGDWDFQRVWEFVAE